MAKHIVVPYFAAKEGDAGQAPVIIGRALARAGFGNLQWATRGRKKWDPRLSTLLRQFEIANGIHPGGTATRAYTQATHAKLARYYDAYNLRLVAEMKADTAEQRLRARKVANCMFLYNMRYQLPYRQWRPWDRRRPPAALDCSGAKGWSDEQAGAPKCGNPWGYGNTWSQLKYYAAQHGIRKGLTTAQPGDAIYFGTSVSNPTHVADYLGRNAQGQDTVFTNGSYPCKVKEAHYRGDQVAVCDLLAELRPSAV